MVASALAILSVALLARLANGLSESSSSSSSDHTTTVGRFPFLMPKVIPYKVSQMRRKICRSEAREGNAQIKVDLQDGCF